MADGHTYADPGVYAVTGPHSDAPAGFVAVLGILLLTRKFEQGLFERWIEESYRLLVHKDLVAMLPEQGQRKTATKKAVRTKAVKKKAAKKKAPRGKKK